MRRYTFAAFALAAAVLAVRPLGAQELVREYPGLETGTMWTFDVPPLAYWAARYDFRPATGWLDHVRLSSVRQPGCSASFVSGQGLVMTNHHCARGCIEAVTREGEDFIEDGFYAATRDEERSCPNFWLDQLLSIRDVTDSVVSAVPSGVTPTQAAEARAAAIVDIQDRCRATGESLNCQVVTMYRGGQYKLYTFRRYTDVRLVFAPDGTAAFFGGDPDNFTYPRYDLDISFYRAYEDGQPVESTDHLVWSAQGSAEGDLVFVVGNPGSTGRLNTIAQMEYLRDVQYPAQLTGYAARIPVLHDLSSADPQRARTYRNQIFGLENSQKAVTGYRAGLLDPGLMEWKATWEKEFRAKVAANPDLKAQYGSAWDEIAKIRAALASVDARRRYHTFNMYGSRLMNVAGMLVRAPIEMAKPDAERARPYQEANRAQLERMLGGTVDTLYERRILAAFFEGMAHELPAGDPVRRVALGNRAPEQAAATMVGQTVLTNPEQVRGLLTGGSAAVAASSDPFIALARVIEPLERELGAKVTDLFDREAQQDERIARALLAVFGNSVAPDATFSLRISDGVVARYPYNGTIAAPYTTFYGLYDRWTAFKGQDPWVMHQRWIDAKDKLDLATPINAVSTNDIIGGNSGSPVINRDGEVVGLIFDGNIEQLPNRFLYTQSVARSVWVDARGIVEALRKVYGAGTLVDELLGH
ncbi:MAG: S46 family peptidase [Gemmatimonadota bacterium]|nr:S46 family peptidase [Gemmatimonadota bacterium]MDH5196405.1 S46 family peptidase [Gemmatimonadota bacterium]